MCYVGPMTAVPGMLCFFLIADDKVACSEKKCFITKPSTFFIEIEHGRNVTFALF